MGDLVCLMQDLTSEVSTYQIPAKLTDAMAMNVPILMTDVPPIRDLAALGAVELLGETPLGEKIAQIFSDYEDVRRRASFAREIYLSEFSYSVNADRLWDVMQSANDRGGDAIAKFEALVDFHREEFAVGQRKVTSRTA
jgi:hypothetical protein